MLVIVFSVRPVIVLLLYDITLFMLTSTLRDILYNRMKGFTHRLFFDILSDTLVTIEYRAKRKGRCEV